MLKFEVTSKTNCISFSGTGTPEYMRTHRHFSDLVTAVEDDLIDVSGHLMSRRMMTWKNHQDFTNKYIYI